MIASEFKKTTVLGIDMLVRTAQSKKTILLMHGFGADCYDLAPLCELLDPKANWNWILPNGTVSADINQHFAGRAWFPIPMYEMQVAAMQGKIFDMSQTVPLGIPEAQKRLLSLLEHMRIKADDLILGGFSQGAMMALQLAANLAQPVGGLILLSGALVNQNEWEEKLAKHSSIPIIQSHGKHDTILGLSQAKALQNCLVKLGFQGEFLEFSGGHEIPMSVISKVRDFLAFHLKRDP